MNAPARDPGDLGVAHGAKPTLKLPEKAKSPRTPKRFRHMISFAFFENPLIQYFRRRRARMESTNSAAPMVPAGVAEAARS